MYQKCSQTCSLSLHNNTEKQMVVSHTVIETKPRLKEIISAMLTKWLSPSTMFNYQALLAGDGLSCLNIVKHF